MANDADTLAKEIEGLRDKRNQYDQELRELAESSRRPFAGRGVKRPFEEGQQQPPRNAYTRGRNFGLAAGREGRKEQEQERPGREPYRPPAKRMRLDAEGTAAPTTTTEEAPQPAEEEKPAAPEKRKIPSSVVVNRAQPKAPTQDVGREKRMFGFLRGTLTKFKQEDQQHASKEEERKRLLASVEEKIQREQEEASRKRREENKALKEEQRKKRAKIKREQDSLRREQDLKEAALLRVKCDAYRKPLNNFIKTKTDNPVFWAPKKHNEKTEALLKECQEATASYIARRDTEIAAQIEAENEAIRAAEEAEAAAEAADAAAAAAAREAAAAAAEAGGAGEDVVAEEAGGADEGEAEAEAGANAEPENGEGDEDAVAVDYS